jgi:hypothetical protein
MDLPVNLPCTLKSRWHRFKRRIGVCGFASVPFPPRLVAVTIGSKDSFPVAISLNP